MKNPMKNIIKIAALALASLLIVVSFAACVDTYRDTPLPSVSPSISPLASPSTSPLTSPELNPSASPSTEPIVPTLSGQESSELADKCNARISAISEIADCESVILGGEAVCWVSFDSAYRGELTERMSNVVSEAVTSVASYVKGTQVSDSQNIKELIRAIREKQKNGATPEELEKDFEALKNAIK